MRGIIISLAHRVPMIATAAALFAAQLVLGQASPLRDFNIAINGPVYTGEPAWVYAVPDPTRNVRYPFHAAMGDFGCNRLEVMRDGSLLTPRVIPFQGLLDGPVCGSAAPKGSPQMRLPLHILYPLTQSGTYELRWTMEGLVTPRSSGSSPLQPIAQSQWLRFTVQQETPEQHETWLNNLLAHTPEDPGTLAGDYIPSLAAAAPDPRVLHVLIGCLYADDPMVAGMAASALELFPQSEVRRAVVNTIVVHGPSAALTMYATQHRGWTAEDEDRVLRASIEYLYPSEARPTAVRPPYNLNGPASAVRLLRFVVEIPNHAWPAIPALSHWADQQVLRAAPPIMTKGNLAAVQELAEYLGAMQPSTQAHE